MKTLALAACAGAALLAPASTALAQSAAAAPAITYGPPIAGLCAVSVDGVIGGSTVGKYVDQRLQQIAAQVQAELSGEKSGIESEARTLDSQRSTLDQKAFEQRVTALQGRQNALERKAAIREREMQATQQQAVGRVINEMKPLIADAAQQQKCAMVVDRSSVIMVNPAMDLTATVVAGLNGKLTQFAFDRTRLEQGQQGAAPAVTQTPAQAPTKRK